MRLDRLLSDGRRLLVVLGGVLVLWLGVATAARADVAPTGAFETSN